MRGKKIIFFSICLVFASFICWMFWEQELQYVMPTPVPVNFVDVKAGDKINLEGHLDIKEGSAVLLHFFNEKCPCSRFNMRDLEHIAYKNKNDLQLIVIIQSDDNESIKRFNDKYELDVPTVLDSKGEISKICGIYATPQAVLLDKESKIYFKGNYNKARFCTTKNTKFVELALGYMKKNEPLPLFLEYAITQPYGCSLPSNEVTTEKAILFGLF